MEYLVKWKCFSDEWNTWECSNNLILSCKEMIEEFHTEHEIPFEVSENCKFEIDLYFNIFLYKIDEYERGNTR